MVLVPESFYITYTIFREIRKFMEQKRQLFDEAQVKDLDGVKIVDLTLRLGQPYVFQHQGSCEHLVIFTDLRLLNPSDEQRSDEYPIKVFGIEHQIFCEACKVSAPS